MIWWIRQPLRAEAERIAIGALAERVPWITHLSWRATDLKLAADFDLKIGERSIPLTLLYPAFFPDVTPLIISRDGVRLSAHQYGAQGELCLEHRPDNWSPDVTGAMMIESAHRLLTLESETGQTAPSEHRTTPAQHLRGEAFRFRLTSEALQGLAAIDAGQAEEIEAVEHAFAGGFTAQLSRFGTAGSPTWTEPDPRGAGASRIRGWALRLQDGSAREVTSFAELATLLEKQGFQDIVHGLREASAATFVIMFDGEKTCPVLADADTGRTFNYRVVLAESPKPRMDREYALLEDATVAVVGCGSLGSKVAAHLARAGFRKFVLVDGEPA